MSKHINIELNDEDYERLKNVKKENGLTWYGMLQRAERFLEDTEKN